LSPMAAPSGDAWWRVITNMGRAYHEDPNNPGKAQCFYQIRGGLNGNGPDWYDL
jgi:hypothetical protein